VLSLPRQNLPPLERPAGFDPKAMLRGGYVVADADNPTMVIVATGSEVSLAVQSKTVIEERGERVRVVSMLCLEAFQRQPEAYRDLILPRGVPRVAIELGVTTPWRGLVGNDGLVIGHDSFGASAPWKVIGKELGFVPEAVAATVRAWRSPTVNP
jgi:transketolase